MLKIALLLLPLALFAAPVGNTAAPEIIHQGFFIPSREQTSLRLGYEGDFVTDGRMGQYDQGTGRVDNYHQYTNSGTITWNLVDRIDLYSVLGMSKTRADWRFTFDEVEIRRIKFKTDGEFLWALGARAILYEWCDIFFGCQGRYSSCDYQLVSLSTDGVSSSTNGALVQWRQWQVGVDFSYKISILTPYIGTKYSHERSYLSGFSTPISAEGTGSNTFKNRDPVGLYLGCTLSNGKFFALNLEGRLIDEEAVTVTADFRF